MDSFGLNAVVTPRGGTAKLLGRISRYRSGEGIQGSIFAYGRVTGLPPPRPAQRENRWRRGHH